jgi:hypothetical protein
MRWLGHGFERVYGTTLVVLLLSACSEGMQSYSDRAKGVDLKQYKTYA